VGLAEGVVSALGGFQPLGADPPLEQMYCDEVGNVANVSQANAFAIFRTEAKQMYIEREV
jgi:hypothetical protein